MTGYPWSEGAELTYIDLNAAFSLAYANDAAANIQSSQALETANSALASSQAAAAARLPMSITLSWPAGQATNPGVYVLTATAPYGFSLSSIDTSVGSAGGSFQINVRSNGASLGNLGALVISAQAKTNTVVTAPAVVAGSLIDVVVSAITGNPAGGYLCLNGLRTLS